MPNDQLTPIEARNQRQFEMARSAARKKAQKETARRQEKTNTEKPQNKKERLLSRITKGRVGKADRTAMTGAALTGAGSAPKNNQDVPPPPQQGVTQQYDQRPADEQAQQMQFNEDQQLRTHQYNAARQAEQRQQEMTKEQESQQQAQAQQNQEQQAAEQENQRQEQAVQAEQQNQNQQRQNQQGGQSKDPTKATERLATAGQVGGRTVQGVSKGVEVTAKGTEMLSKGVKQGGQAMTRAGAELSSTGLGAIAGVPMMVAGGTMVAGGAIGEATSKGVEKGAKATGKMGKRVAETSKKAKSGLKEAKGAGLGDSTGMPYMDLARKLRMEKQKALQGNVAGVVTDTMNTAAQMLSAKALTWAWFALIPTFGLSLIYIDIHMIARMMKSEKFCKIGTEWAMAKMGGQGGKISEFAEENAAFIGKIEIGIAIALHIIIALIIIAVKILIDLSICFQRHPIDTFLHLSSCYTNQTQ